jgi:DNA-binding transcriptional ArsR family regulator
MNIQDMKASAEQAAGLMRVLANEKRLLLLCLLFEEEQSVGALVDRLGARQSAVSQQLAQLRREGIVTTRRDGQYVYCRLASDEARRVLEVLYGIYCAPEPAGDRPEPVTESSESTR